MIPARDPKQRRDVKLKQPKRATEVSRLEEDQAAQDGSAGSKAEEQCGRAIQESSTGETSVARWSDIPTSTYPNEVGLLDGIWGS